MNVNVINGTLEQQELDAYIARAYEKYPHQDVTCLDIRLDGDFVELHYHVAPVPFQRIRRITGYLVGTMDNWNDAKRAEEGDRVKHGVSLQMEQI